MKVEAIEKFRDLKVGKIRKIGDRFIVSKGRYEVLKYLGFVKEVKEESEEAAKEAAVFMPEGSKLHGDTGEKTE